MTLSVLYAWWSEAIGKRMAVPWTTGCRSTKPLKRMFVDFRDLAVLRT